MQAKTKAVVQDSNPSADFEIESCQVCLEEYNPTLLGKRPMILPCGHTFCATCAHSLGCRTCPFCRKEAQSKPSQVNLDLERQVEILNACQTRDKLGKELLQEAGMGSNLWSRVRGAGLDVQSFDKWEGQFNKVGFSAMMHLMLFSANISDNQDEYKQILSKMLLIGAELDSNLDFLKTAITSKGDSFSRECFQVLKSQIEGKKSTSDPLLACLHRLRELQKLISPDVIWIANQVNSKKLDPKIPNLPRMDAGPIKQVITEMKADRENGLHLSPNRRQIEILPALRHNLQIQE